MRMVSSVAWAAEGGGLEERGKPFSAGFDRLALMEGKEQGGGRGRGWAARQEQRGQLLTTPGSQSPNK